MFKDSRVKHTCFLCMWRRKRGAEGDRDKTVVDENSKEKLWRGGFHIKNQFVFGSNNKIIGIDL